MENLGLFKGSPEQTLSKEQALALFRANQKNRKLTRVPGDQFRPILNAPTRSKTTSAEALAQTLRIHGNSPSKPFSSSIGRRKTAG
ncbi:MAG TPA: hypothetical protein PLB55_15170 [Prosthecobacter sp.]|nr:hypothetical protein [Prosthecobacter sp.]